MCCLFEYVAVRYVVELVSRAPAWVSPAWPHLSDWHPGQRLADSAVLIMDLGHGEEAAGWSPAVHMGAVGAQAHQRVLSLSPVQSCKSICHLHFYAVFAPRILALSERSVELLSGVGQAKMQPLCL